MIIPKNMHTNNVSNMVLKERKNGYIGGFGGRTGNGKLYTHIIISKIK